MGEGRGIGSIIATGWQKPETRSLAKFERVSGLWAPELPACLPACLAKSLGDK